MFCIFFLADVNCRYLCATSTKSVGNSYWPHMIHAAKAEFCCWPHVFKVKLKVPVVVTDLGV